MKTLLLIALLCGAPATASAQDYEELADVNMVAETALAPALAVDPAVYADNAAAARPRAVRVAAHTRSLTVALAHPAAQIVMASADIGS